MSNKDTTNASELHEKEVGEILDNLLEGLPLDFMGTGSLAAEKLEMEDYVINRKKCISRIVEWSDARTKASNILREQSHLVMILEIWLRDRASDIHSSMTDSEADALRQLLNTVEKLSEEENKAVARVSHKTKKGK